MRLCAAGRPALLVIAVVIVSLVGAYLAARPPSPEERAASAQALVGGIKAWVVVHRSKLLAARAIADFGVGEEVRLVGVRIVEELELEVRLEVANEVEVGSPVVACLVGPDPAPDDAGLSDRCWGDGSLESILTRTLTDQAGRARFTAGSTTISTTVGRGTERCDYPPGSWHLELRVDPIVAGVQAGPVNAVLATFEVPFDRTRPLRPVTERRYCGLASKVYREQGEPPVLPP